MLFALVLLIAGILLLAAGAEGLVRGASSLALRLGMTPLVIGLTVVAFGTSAPELVATLRATVAGSPDMAMGNVIGSNISNIALVLGIAALISPLQVSPQVIRRDAPLSLFASFVLFLFLWDGALNRMEGAVLFAGILIYVFVSLRISKARGSDLKAPVIGEQVEEMVSPMPLHWSIPLTLVGLLGLVFGADFFVNGARRMAEIFGVPEAVVGLTLMAVGTSLPEIATVVAASLKGYSDIITGNAIGSNIFNVLAVLGLTSLVFPLSLGDITMIDLTVFLASAVLIWIMLATRRTLSRFEALLLLSGYVAYVSYLYFI